MGNVDEVGRIGTREFKHILEVQVCYTVRKYGTHGIYCVEPAPEKRSSGSKRLLLIPGAHTGVVALPPSF